MSTRSKTANKSDIDLHITSNANHEITAAELNGILENLVDSYEDFIGSYNSDALAAYESPALRQIAYNTTLNAYYYYDGTRWVPFSSPKYKVYTALLSQDETENPNVIVLENTIGAISWTRDEAGVYHGILSSAFTTNKTWVSIPSIPAADKTKSCYAIHETANRVIVYTETAEGPADGLLSATPIEIRVYY